MSVIRMPIIIIDFHSAPRTIQFIFESRQFFTGIEPIYVVIDNSCSQRNYDELCSQLSCCDELSKMDELEQANGNTERNIFLLKAKENYGFAKSNNFAYRFIKDWYDFDYAVFSNNDIQFLGIGSAGDLIDEFNKHPDVGLIGPRIIGLNGKPQSPCKYVDIVDRWIKLQLLWPLNKLFKRVNTNDISPQEESGYVYRVIGAFMLVRSSAFDEAGMFDEHTFLYCEEPILAERLADKGFKAYYCYEVQLIHEGGYTTGKTDKRINIKKAKQTFVSELYYYSKYRNESIIKLTMAKIAFRLYCLKAGLANSLVK